MRGFSHTGQSAHLRSPAHLFSCSALRHGRSSSASGPPTPNVAIHLSNIVLGRTKLRGAPQRDESCWGPRAGPGGMGVGKPKGDCKLPISNCKLDCLAVGFGCNSNLQRNLQSQVDQFAICNFRICNSPWPPFHRMGSRVLFRISIAGGARYRVGQVCARPFGPDGKFTIDNLQLTIGDVGRTASIIDLPCHLGKLSIVHCKL